MKKGNLVFILLALVFIGPSVSAESFHPADSSTDWSLSLDEFTAYNSAFKRGNAWPIPPSPIDIDYYTRAIYLLKRGPNYFYSPSSACPSCWMNGTDPTSIIPKKQLILIGIDGMQVAHYKEMRAAGKLPNFARLVSMGGWEGNATITGHSATETSPGNAELHTGLGSSLNGVSANDCTSYVPSGKTTFERLSAFDKNITLGLVYGKGTCYIPDSILRNAKSKVNWWYNRTNYPQTTYVSANCADSRNVSKKALEFISTNKNKSFYIAVYFGVPDCAGHTYGENTVEYDNSLINADAGLGILLDWLVANKVSAQILISGDHGWNENTKGHGTADINTKTIILASNNATMVSRIYSQGLRKQCDIAPTTLNYFGMNPTQYSDITNFGCGSMIT